MRINPDPEGMSRLALDRTVQKLPDPTICCQTQPFAALQHKEDWAKVQGKTCDRLQHVPKKPGGAAPSSERADALSGKAILVAFTG
jgi:hypothetical protein